MEKLKARKTRKERKRKEKDKERDQFRGYLPMFEEREGSTQTGQSSSPLKCP